MPPSAAPPVRYDDPRLGKLVKGLRVPAPPPPPDAVTNVYAAPSDNNDSDIEVSPAVLAVADAAIVGFPYDEGVRRNGGRVGSAEGPAAFRRTLPKIGTLVNREFNADLTKLTVVDAGDADAPTLETAHGSLRLLVRSLLEHKHSCVPFVVGGGNDQSFSNASALIDVSCKRTGQRSPARVAVINIDAHTDVRPLLADGHGHSGSPFRQLLNDPRFSGKNFIEFAVQGGCCASAHVDYVKEKGGDLVWLSQIRRSGDAPGLFRKTLDKLAGEGDEKNEIFVSFDIDAIAQRDCPGVSAPATIGLSSEDALMICYEAGLHPQVKLVDLSEFNPKIEDETTSRLVSNMFYYFLLGLYARLHPTSA